VQHGRAGAQAVPRVLALLGRSCNPAFNGAKGDREAKSSRLSTRICSVSLSKQSREPNRPPRPFPPSLEQPQAPGGAGSSLESCLPGLRELTSTKAQPEAARCPKPPCRAEGPPDPWVPTHPRCPWDAGFSSQPRRTQHSPLAPHQPSALRARWGTHAVEVSAPGAEWLICTGLISHEAGEAVAAEEGSPVS